MDTENSPSQHVDIDQVLAELVPALVMGAEGDIYSANASMLRALGVSAEELASENLFARLLQLPTWLGSGWVSPMQQIALFKTYMEAAKAHGRSGAEVNFLTPNCMLYRGSVNLLWQEETKTFFLWANINDVVTQRDPHGVAQIWASEDAINQDGDPPLKQRDIQLLMNYCQSRSVAELAESHNTTRKSMEHRLRLLAESQGYASITEMNKALVMRVLKRFGSEYNTIVAFGNFDALDAIRKKILARHNLPPSLRRAPTKLNDPELKDWIEQKFLKD